MTHENMIIKDWGKIDISFGLIYPNIYKIGMSSYSIRLLYAIINEYEKIACERIFLPEKIKFPASDDFSSRNCVRSIENKVLPGDFDILGFSMHFENDFRNILWILDKAGIPLSSNKRFASAINKEKQYPLIIGGGPVATSNPLPLSQFFDLFFIGDAEPNLDQFFNLFNSYNSNEMNYYEFLEKAKDIEGLFISSIKNKVKRAVLKDLDESPIPAFQLRTQSLKEGSIFENNSFIEVNRGCPFQCKFCISSFHNSPFRNRNYDSIVKTIDQWKNDSNLETISLIGSCVSAHPKFYEICKHILDTGKRLTIPSIRIEHITPKIIQVLEEGNIKTITIAPETGSPKLRFELGKKIQNEQILTALRHIKNSRIKNVKMYFLIGLPGEDDGDIEAIISLLKDASTMGFEKDSLRVNINPFVPKHNTPYGREIHYYLNDNLSKLREKYQKIEQALKSQTVIKLKFLNYRNIVKDARLQALFSLGDEKVSDLLKVYYSYGATQGALRRAEEELDFSINDYFLKIQQQYPPWSF